MESLVVVVVVIHIVVVGIVGSMVVWRGGEGYCCNVDCSWYSHYPCLWKYLFKSGIGYARKVDR